MMEIVLENDASRRSCGGCTLCCKLVPVADLDKLAGERCKHQRGGRGCAIYARRPDCCRFWTCRWLTNQDTADLRRPDRAHYVIDALPDFVVTTQDGEPRGNLEVVQVWVDPDYPDAHRDPALRDYLDRMGERNVAALIRFDGSRGFVLIPPSMTGGDWIEKHGDCAPERTPEEWMAGLATVQTKED